MVIADSFAQDTKEKGNENKIKQTSSKNSAGKQPPKKSTELKKGTSVAFPKGLLQHYDGDMMPPSSTPLKVYVNFQLQKNVAMVIEL